MATDLRLQFGEFTLDQHNACVWHGAETLKLKPKAFDVLHYLVEHPGQLVSKDDLWQAVWPNVAVTDGVLAVCLTEIRQALGDEAKAPRYIETVHRRGYRFIGKVVRSQQEEVRSEQLGVRNQQEEAQSTNGNGSLATSVQSLELEREYLASSVQRRESEPPPVSLTAVQTRDLSLQSLDVAASTRPRSRKRVWFTGLFLLVGAFLIFYFLLFPSLLPPYSSLFTQEVKSPALPLPDKPSLIVLPLVNLSGDSEQEYFSDGLTEVLTGDLSKISSLFVIARNSAFTYKGKAVKVQDVSKEMGVRYVLEGSVQKAEQRVRIAVQLIDAITGYHVWSEQYDRPLTDIFALQDEIVQKIVTTLKLQLTLEEQGIIIRKHTNNLEAYDTFLRGQAYYWRFTPEAHVQARQLYKHALALDPQYAEAYVCIGGTYLNEWLARWGPFQVVEQARTLAQHALDLDDSLPGAHSLLGGVYAAKQQYEQAIAEGEQSITLAPNDADLYSNLALTLNLAGRHEDARRTVQQAIRLNPHAPPTYLFNLGYSNFLTGRYTEAITALQGLSSRHPTFPFAASFLAASYWWQWAAQLSPTGQTLEPAMAAAQQALALNDSSSWNHALWGWLLLLQRQYDQALAQMERAVSLEPNFAYSAAALAVGLLYVGRTEEALEAAAKALELKEGLPDVHLADVGEVYALAGGYEEARPLLQRYLARYPNYLPAHLTLAFVDSELGQEAEAQKEAAEVLRLNPKFSLEVHRQRKPIKDPAVLERHIAALRRAGLK